VTLALLLACGTFGLAPPGVTPSEDEDPALEIVSLDPSWGSPDGGTEVTLTGPGMGTVTSVDFGNAEIDDITRIDSTSIVVTTPGPGFETVVDVRVVGSAGADTLSGGFTYAEEAPADADTDTDSDSDADSDADSDTDTDADTSGAGKTGGVIELGLIQYACTACYDPVAPAIDVYAYGAFHEPTRDGWLDWLPAEGDCVTNPTVAAPTEDYIDAGEWLYLSSGSRSVAMRSDSTYTFAANDLSESDFLRNAGYDVSLAGGGDDLAGFDVADGIQTPEAISSLTPTEIILTDPSRAFSARIAKSGAGFTWGPSGGGGSFVIDLGLYNGSSGAYLGQVVCRGPDNGRMSIPSSALSAYPTGSLVSVGMFRYVIGGFERPDNASTVQTTALFGVVGTGSLTP
jgi:hypothetical protein